MRQISVFLFLIFGILNGNAQQNSLPVTHPLYPYTIDGLRESDYIGGDISIRYIMEENEAFTQYYVSYPSDGLTITGVMNIPKGNVSSPVVILLHGYYDRETYWSGMGTWQEASYFARSGFVTIAPDFRTWGESDTGLNLFATGLVVDTINLIHVLDSIPQIDTEHIFLWGHSMGGGVVTKVLTVNEQVDATILYAPNSANDGDLMERWGLACLSGQSQLQGDKCNPAEVIFPDTPSKLQNEYFATATHLEAIQSIAPIYHLDKIVTPIQIHIGTADGATLSQTPPTWSENLYQALLQAEREVDYFVYPNQGHFFNGEDWIRLLQRAVNFFNAQLLAETT